METLDDVIQKKMRKSLLSFSGKSSTRRTVSRTLLVSRNGIEWTLSRSVRCTSICSIANGEVKASTVHRMTSSPTAIRTPLTGTDDH